MIRRKPPPGWLDWMAVAMSGLCLVHCLALPLLLVSLPALGVLANGDKTHWVLLALALPVSLWALGRGRAGPLPLLIGATGLGLMTLAVAMFEGRAADRWLTVAGVLLVAVAHVVRWRRGHRGHGHRLDAGGLACDAAHPE